MNGWAAWPLELRLAGGGGEAEEGEPPHPAAVDDAACAALRADGTALRLLAAAAERCARHGARNGWSHDAAGSLSSGAAEAAAAALSNLAAARARIGASEPFPLDCRRHAWRALVADEPPAHVGALLLAAGSAEAALAYMDVRWAEEEAAGAAGAADGKEGLELGVEEAVAAAHDSAREAPPVGVQPYDLADASSWAAGAAGAFGAPVPAEGPARAVRVALAAWPDGKVRLALEVAPPDALPRSGAPPACFRRWRRPRQPGAAPPGRSPSRPAGPRRPPPRARRARAARARARGAPPAAGARRGPGGGCGTPRPRRSGAPGKRPGPLPRRAGPRRARRAAPGACRGRERPPCCTRRGPARGRTRAAPSTSCPSASEGAAPGARR